MAENLYLPYIPSSPMYVGEENKTMTVEWHEFFRSLFDRVGGTTAPSSSELSISAASELFKTDKNYAKRIDELEQQIKILTAPKSYDKRIDELEQQIKMLTAPKSYDKRIDELERIVLTISEPHPNPSTDEIEFFISAIQAGDT